MNKVSLLTASKVDPSVSICHRRHSSSRNNRIIKHHHFAALVRLQTLVLSSVSFVLLCLRAYTLASLTSVGILSTAFKTFFFRNLLPAAKFATHYTFKMSTKGATEVWESRGVQVMRRKLFYEFAIFILGSGNALIVMLFWPGWWLLAGACWAAWQLIG